MALGGKNLTITGNLTVGDSQTLGLDSSGMVTVGGTFAHGGVTDIIAAPASGETKTLVSANTINRSSSQVTVGGASAGYDVASFIDAVVVFVDGNALKVTGASPAWYRTEYAHGDFYLSGSYTIATDLTDRTGSYTTYGNWNGKKLEKWNGGTLTLTGTNTYTGGTIIREGTIAGNISANGKVEILDRAKYDGLGQARAIGSVIGQGDIVNTNGLTIMVAPNQEGAMFPYNGAIDASNTGGLTIKGDSSAWQWLLGSVAYTGSTSVESGNLLGNLPVGGDLYVAAGAAYVGGEYVNPNNGVVSYPQPRSVGELTGANGYTGGTTVTGGTLTLGASGTLGTGGLTLQNGTTFDISAASKNIASLTATEATFNLGDKKALTVTGNATIDGGTIELASAIASGNYFDAIVAGTLSVTNLPTCTGYNVFIIGGKTLRIAATDYVLPTYAAALTVKKDDAAYISHGKTFELILTGNEATAYAMSGADGTVTASVPDRTWKVYEGSDYTGIDITINGATGSATLNYYTVQFGVMDAGTAGGSTISATYDGTAITAGNVVLGGKTLVVTASGAGATTYAYAWSGAGTSGETTDALTINSLAAAVNATCAATGTDTGTPPAPPAPDPLNNITISGEWTNLGDDKSGAGWTWDGTTKTLTLTGDTTDEIKIASETEEITIYIENNVNVPKIVKTGNGPLRITGAADKKLTVENTNGPAISSKGDIYIDGGTVKAIVSSAGNTEPAIKAGGDITITGTTNVLASNSGTGANSSAITITGGHTEVTDQSSGTNPYPPAMSGANTVVIVNGLMIFGNPTTPNNPDNSDESGDGSRGGCDAGAGVFALALPPLACAGMKRKRK